MKLPARIKANALTSVATPQSRALLGEPKKSFESGVQGRKISDSSRHNLVTPKLKKRLDYAAKKSALMDQINKKTHFGRQKLRDTVKSANNDLQEFLANALPRPPTTIQGAAESEATSANPRPR